MNSQIFNVLQKPMLWQRSKAPFWDDEHISKCMLEAHLNPDWDAASRKIDTIKKSVKWIASLIPTNSRVLDLGCGPGLYCSRLSGLGFDVTGIDFSKRSINYAKENDKHTNYIYQNYLSINYSDSFDLIIMIYCDFAALTLPERKVLLSKVYSALKPNGIFILDVFTDVHFKAEMLLNRWTVNENGGFWSALPYVHLEGNYSYADNTVTVNQNVVITAKGTKEYLIWNTVYNVQRLEDEVSHSGFKVDGVYSDVCGKQYMDDSETLCFVIRKSN